MRTISDIKDEVVQDYGWESWEEIYDAGGVTNHIIEVIAERTAREALNNAYFNSKVMLDPEDDLETCWIVERNSIISDKNIPEL